MITHCFTKMGPGFGAAEGGLGANLSTVVVAGHDPRNNDEAFVNQLFVLGNGGPGREGSDGWQTWCTPGVSGMMWYDSWEIDEFKYPIIIEKLEAQTDTAAAGRFRGAPQMEFVVRSRCRDLSIVLASDSRIIGPKGALGGEGGRTGSTYLLDVEGTPTRVSNFYQGEMGVGDRMRGLCTGGGGYGHPYERDPNMVLNDVLEGYVSLEQAQEKYGVCLSGEVRKESLVIDYEKTTKTRDSMAAAAQS